MSSFPSFANLSSPGQKKNSKLERRKSTNAPPAAASAARSLNPATRILCRAGLDRSSDSSEDRSPPSRWASSVVAAAPPAAFARESCGGSGWSATAAPAAPAVPETARAGGGSAAAGRPLPSCCSAFSETIVDFLDGCGESGETSAAAAAAAAAATAAAAAGSGDEDAVGQVDAGMAEAGEDMAEILESWGSWPELARADGWPWYGGVR